MSHDENTQYGRGATSGAGGSGRRAQISAVVPVRCIMALVRRTSCSSATRRTCHAKVNSCRDCATRREKWPIRGTDFRRTGVVSVKLVTAVVHMWVGEETA